jgi:hypothetical protein
MTCHPRKRKRKEMKRSMEEKKGRMILWETRKMMSN